MNTTKASPLGTNSKTTEMQDRKAVLSTLWIFLVANYIYCDVFSHMDPAFIKELITGTIGSIQVTQGFFRQFKISTVAVFEKASVLGAQPR